VEITTTFLPSICTGPEIPPEAVIYNMKLSLCILPNAVDVAPATTVEFKLPATTVTASFGVICIMVFSGF
jgi:hypothetical protein